MAGKKPAPPSSSKPKAQAAPASIGAANANSKLKTWRLALLVVIVTAITFSGVTKLEWTNWDDDEYVYENQMVMNGDYAAIFTNDVNNNYNPLPVAMMALEWSLQDENANLEDRAALFHFNNLWMHLLCTLLAFFVLKELGLKPIWAALAALFFGVNPLRVESVAWITERKDVMFGAFYLGALLTYLRYMRDNAWPWLVLTFVLFALSCFSKIQAVSLPLSLFAIDWYKGRKLDWRSFGEKIPFLLGALATGYVGITFLEEGAALDATETFSFAERVPLGFTAYFFYVLKAFVPWQTCTFYPYPSTVEPMYYLIMVGAFLVMGLAFMFRKRAPEVAFGIAFFTVNIIFLLQIVGAGSAYMADRFAYIAHLGLFFSFAMVAQKVSEKTPNLKFVFIGIMGVMGLAFAAISMRYVKDWKNSDTLWSDVIEKYPDRVPVAYANRGQYLRRKGQQDRAFADFDKAVRLSPEYHLGYLNRGNIYFDRGQDDAALADYTKVISLLSPIDTLGGHEDPALEGALSNRGAIYARKKMYPEALADYALALKLKPENQNTWNNRATTYFGMGDYTRAIPDYTQAAKLDPTNIEIVNARGVCYLRLNQFDPAIADFNFAAAKDARNPNYFLNRAYAYFGKGDKASALTDLQKAQSLGATVDPAFVAALQ